MITFSERKRSQGIVGVYAIAGDNEEPLGLFMMKDMCENAVWHFWPEENYTTYISQQDLQQILDKLKELNSEKL